MDVRDLAFWSREAQKKLVGEQMKLIQAVRIGMAQDGDYERIIAEMDGQMNDIEGNPQCDWEYFRSRGKGCV